MLLDGFIGRKPPALCFFSPLGPPPRLHLSCLLRRCLRPCVLLSLLWHSFDQIFSFQPNPFPKAARTLKGVFRLVPTKARDPLPWLVLVLFCDYWLSQGAPLLAAAALLQLDTYLRPGENFSA